ncbi:energy-coupling factor transporter transmembrane component T family protein [Alteribacter natronophilus]|uniref:energy-coupling factor transporter transmembrane component T family protein n=1 Tax=Alteribacter natronophilus TaxID=2583810 RepID=UPI00110E7FA6|nr:energy-coupling factor transporter transmembrane component T [Alteribacter natronophilus]TMW70289.1 energy-coupling factor transporter transmembrane protein EcfT [Alteribacter natronophilus]
MLSSVNPSVKAMTILIPGVLLAFMFDIFTPLAYLIFTVAMTFILSDIPVKRYLAIFSPFIIVALGFSWMTMLYTSDRFAGGEIVFSFLWFDITEGAIITAVSLGIRSLCIVALSLMFVLTTDSTKFMLSLMQQAKLPPKLTFGILAGYRFLPTFRHEFEVLRQAHRIRGVGRAKGIRGRIRQFRRYSIPLMANAIRKAERVAIAMESKGFTGSTGRTHYHEMKVGRKDWMFFSAFVTAFFAVVFASYLFGYLNIFGYQF